LGIIFVIFICWFVDQIPKIITPSFHGLAFFIFISIPIVNGSHPRNNPRRMVQNFLDYVRGDPEAGHS